MSEKILLIKAAEITSYIDYDGFSFGECNSLIEVDNTINLHKIFGISDKLNVFSGVTVAYCTEKENGDMVICSIFKNAEVYKYAQYYDMDLNGYYIKSNAENVFNIPEEKRNFKICLDGDYAYISDEKLSRYIDDISKDEYCIKFDVSIVKNGLKEAGNDIGQLHKLFNKVFSENSQTKLSEPIITHLRSLSDDAKTKKNYAMFLHFSNKYAEALKLFTELYNANSGDDLLIRMALCNLDLGFNTEAMMLLDKVRDKSKMDGFNMDYEWLKKSMPYISNAEYIDNREILKYAVSLPFDNMPLPKTVKVDGVKKYFDPVRKKGVLITREEKVRQQVLRYLIDVCHIPTEYIVSEDSLAHYDKGNIQRADITVKVDGQTLLLVECKENGISIDGNPLHQILGYQSTIRSRYLLLTNGICSYIYLSEDNGALKPLSELPDFAGMCKSAGTSVPMRNITSKRPDVSEFTFEEIQNYKNDGQYLGVNTPKEICPVILNLAWFFLDSSYSMENIEGYGCKIIKDLGAVNTIVSNASGGTYNGQYRQLLVQDRSGNEQSICFSVFGTMANGTRGGYTSLVCPIEIDSHLTSKLQVRLDKSLINVSGQRYSLYHDGTRSRKSNASMINYVKDKCPQLIRNGKIYLGEFDNSKNITINSPGAKDFIARLVSYVILRKELSSIEKE